MANVAEAKRDRVISALEGREPDRVPIGEFFWSNFLRRARDEMLSGAAFDPYRFWDLDFVVINPNMAGRTQGLSGRQTGRPRATRR